MTTQQEILLSGNAGQIVKWLENQPIEKQQDFAAATFEHLYSEAAQPKSVSGNACVRLCGLVEQSSKSSSSELHRWTFSYGVTLKLFGFYIDWNEYDHHRSMRLVLDLIATLLRRNPDQDGASATKKALLDHLISIVMGRSNKPVAKSAIKTLDHFLCKCVFTLDDVHASYEGHCNEPRDRESNFVWGMLMSDVLDWMRLQFMCPAAGKLVVTLYRMLRQGRAGTEQILSIDLWHSWLLALVAKDESLVERVKNYIFLPLFKSDRKESVLFLKMMNNAQPVSASEKLDVDSPRLLQLAALETGKRVGLVEEPDLSDCGKGQCDAGSILLHEEVLESVLGHPSGEVRSLAFSILIASPSTTKPYSARALQLLRKHLGAFFADADAKFRVDVSARARDMFKRVRGAISVLMRSIPRVRAKAAKGKRRSDDVAKVADTAASTVYKNNIIVLPEENLEKCLKCHQDFLEWYLEFLCEELVPTASYQRHIASLKALSYILRIEGDKSKTWETTEDQALFFDVLDDKWMRALLDLLMDPFEDVRDAASTVLLSVLSDKRYRKFWMPEAGSDAHNVALKELRKASHRANELARRSARADHADGVARVNQLLYRFLTTSDERITLLSGMIDELDEKIILAETDLGRAVLEAPVHADFASLCSMWQVVSEVPLSDEHLRVVEGLQERLLRSCVRVWNSVKSILCDDSPEGNLPWELQEMDGLDTKGLISYSFRAIHESSNLMRFMILAIRNKSRKGSVIPSKKGFHAIGKLTFEQLCNLRHRGAFTNVSSTFAVCCQQSRHLKPAETEDNDNYENEDILLTWYKGALDAIKSQVSTTRRSAGIPFLITGILSANAKEPSFESVMETLMRIASTEARVREIDETHLPQVHAYNCLKDIFKNSTLTSLGNKSEAYLPQCLELAASGLRSEVWAIRNCGLIFLRSLTDCLFGSHESKEMIEAGWDGKANRIPYHRYPKLPEVLRDLLKSGHRVTATASTLSSAAAESVFPALDIIRRAGPPTLLRDEIQRDVTLYLSSSVWHVREMAARTLCSCLLHDSWLASLKQVYAQAYKSKGGSRLNHLHGVLLTFKFVFERFQEVSPGQLRGKAYRLIQTHVIRLVFTCLFADLFSIADLPEIVDFISTSNIPVDFAYCPDLVATYLEVLNQVWALQLADGLPLQPAVPGLSDRPDLALLKDQRTTNQVLLAYRAEEPLAALRAILLNPQAGVNTMMVALETASRLWNPATSAKPTLLLLLSLYMDVALMAACLEIQTAAVENLADVLDVLLEDGRAAVQTLPVDKLTNLWARLPLGPMNPSLSNALIRVGGGIVAALHFAGKLNAKGMSIWAVLMADAGLDDKMFDTRFAAAQSFCTFFAVIGPDCTASAFLPVLVALYDTLNDDDEDVRDLGSRAFTLVSGVSLVPTEAADRLVRHLAATFGDLHAFHHIAARRIMGDAAVVDVVPARIGTTTTTTTTTLQSAGEQLDAALRVDDSLFAVEEQNLFVDEVRETKRWAGVFAGLDWGEAVPATSTTTRHGRDDALVLATLAAWVGDGIDRLAEVVKTRPDGPLGWASDAHVFAVVTRILHGYLALVGCGAADEELTVKVDGLKMAMGSLKEGPVSRLLVDVLQ